MSHAIFSTVIFFHSSQVCSLSVDFLCSSVVPFLIDNSVLTWNVRLIRCYKNRLHGAKYPHLEATGTFSIKF